MKEPVTRLDDCPYLLVRQITDTLTNVADHTAQFAPAAINRSLRGARRSPRLVWEHGANQIVQPSRGSGSCDDTVLDKHASCASAVVRRQDRGNAGDVITGSGVVTGGAGNPATDPCWVIDERSSDPAGAGTTTRDQVRALRGNHVDQQHLPWRTVLMDTWSATTALLRSSESVQQLDDGPVNANRQVDDAGGTRSKLNGVPVDIGAYDTCFKIDTASVCFDRVKRMYTAASAEDRLELDLFPGEHGWGGNKSAAFFKKHLEGA